MSLWWIVKVFYFDLMNFDLRVTLKGWLALLFDLGDCERIRRREREGESFFYLLFFKTGMALPVRSEPDHCGGEQDGHSGVGPVTLRRDCEEAAAVPQAGGLQGGWPVLHPLQWAGWWEPHQGAAGTATDCLVLRTHPGVTDRWATHKLSLTALWFCTWDWSVLYVSASTYIAVTWAWFLFSSFTGVE